MSETARQPKLIWKTPLRDLLRGRITGRLDWEGRLKRAELPDTARELILRVVKRTRLWRLEKAAVAEELIAHFADALEDGRRIESALRLFGDEKIAAALIRRAKTRNRPLIWHIWKWLLRGVWVLGLLYGVLFIKFLTSRATVKVDYLSRLNAATLATPLEQRAWPVYEATCEKLDRSLDNNSAYSKAFDDWDSDRLIAAPDQTLAQWAREHVTDFDTLRRAAGLPVLGYVVTDGGWPENSGLSAADRDLMHGSILYATLRFLGPVRSIARMFEVDARSAWQSGDGGRVIADATAVLELADQVCHSNTYLVTQLVSLQIREEGLHNLDEALTNRPEILDLGQLEPLEAKISTAHVPADWLSIQNERDVADDLMQRIFTDEGHGNGRVTPDGLHFLQAFMKVLKTQPAVIADEFGIDWNSATGPVQMSSSPTRAQMSQLYRRNLDRLQDMLINPDLKDAYRLNKEQIQEIAAEKEASGVFGIFIFATNRVPTFAERALGHRDGVLVGIALERYQRAKGKYPASLDALVPAYLPAVPIDRVAGGPVRYRLIDGRPVVYSVGFDSVDDGGRAALVSDEPSANAAAEWSENTPSSLRGDWILFGPVKSPHFSADGRADRR